jgi:hypothetical protein
MCILETDMPRFKRASRARRHDYLRAPRVIFDAEPVEPVPDVESSMPIEYVADRERDRADTGRRMPPGSKTWPADARESGSDAKRQ